MRRRKRKRRGSEEEEEEDEEGEEEEEMEEGNVSIKVRFTTRASRTPEGKGTNDLFG